MNNSNPPDWRGLQDPTLPAEARALLTPYRMLGRMMLWCAALRRQRDRIVAADEMWAGDNEIEAALFAMALGSFLRAANVVRKVVRNKEIEAAMNRFDANVPNAVDIRDVLVHFDAYEQGKGHLQKKAIRENRRVPYFWTWYQRTPDNYYLRLGDSFVLDVRDATERAVELVEATNDVLMTWNPESPN